MTTQLKNTTQQIKAALADARYPLTKWDYYQIIDAVSYVLEQLSPADDPMPGVLVMMSRDEEDAWFARHPYSPGIMTSVVSSLQALLRMRVPDRAWDPEVTHPCMHTLLRAATNAQMVAADAAIAAQDN